MIPTHDQIMALWDLYELPDYKRVHMGLVEKVAIFFAKRLTQKAGVMVNTHLLSAAALLHDIDKAIPKGVGEHHPDTAVRVLREVGMGVVADLVRTHSLSAILDEHISPKTWEEKILFLSDKMVKREIVGVDKRFQLWRAEHLPPIAMRQLDESYPLVKALEKEICDMVQIDPDMVALLA